MKYYAAAKIDSQGRVYLKDFIEPGAKVVIYVDDSDISVIHIEPYLDLDHKDIPKCGIHRVSTDKPRVCVPKAMLGDAKRCLVTDDGKNGVLLKLVF